MVRVIIRKYGTPLFFFILVLIGASADRSMAAVSAIAPNREIQVESLDQGTEKPSWKTIWDEARQLARSHQLEKAKKSYLTLLSLKPNIIEARWEYCKLLISLNEWPEASQIIEGILESEPNNLEYLISAGNIALKNAHFQKAVRYFGQAYEAEPVGTLSETAIAGMIKGFKSLTNYDSAFQLLEQLYQRGKIDADVLEELAELSRVLGYDDKARLYWNKLVQLFPNNKNYIYQAAQIFESTGYDEEAEKYWQKYLEIDPNYLPFHKKLADSFLKKKEEKNALPHLIKLYSQDYLATDLALRIANIYHHTLKRSDKALLYYEQYLKVFPDAEKVNITIKKIREDLAHQYLPIVENNAADRLWQDLDLITQSKEVIFFMMADILDQQKKTEQEIAVLEILHDGIPTDLDLVYRLAKLYLQLGNLEQSGKLLSILHIQHYQNIKYLLTKADYELQNNLERRALQTLSTYLQHDRSDISASMKSLDLAGELGLVKMINSIWEMLPTKNKDSIAHLDLTLAYLTSLRRNGLFSDTDVIYEELLGKIGENNKALATVYFHRADTLFLEESVFEAEQLVRQALAKNLEADKAIEKLISFSLHEKRVARAKSWLNLLAERLGIADIEQQTDNLPTQLYFYKIEMLLEEEEYDQARTLILSHPNYKNENISTYNFRALSSLYLARSYFLQEEFGECLEIIKKSTKNEQNRDEFYVLEKLSQEKDNRITESTKPKNNQTTEASFSSLVERARIFTAYGKYHDALISINDALKIIPKSMRAKIVKIKILSALSRFNEALVIADKIANEYPEQDYFEKIKLDLEFKSGHFEKIVEKVNFRKVNSSEPVGESKQTENENMYFWKKLLLARALWAENKREEAIKVYDSLLAVPVDTMFLEKVEVEKINFYLPPLKKSFWDAIPFYDPDAPDPITTVMDPHFVANNIGQPIDDIAASMYGKYRWQELIKKELSARKAVEQRDYYRAEKEYVALMKEEKSQETIFDLASIYDRLGLYGKAAELYELMKEKGPLYPGLDEYIQSNLLKRQPRISVSFLTDSKKGRDGYVNLKKRSYGVEGWIMPSFDQEVNVSWYRNSYASSDRRLKSWSDTIIGTYSTYFENTIDINISFGLDIPTDAGNNEILYKFELIKRINKSLEAYGRFEQDLVEDTMRSVTDSVIYRDFEAGVKYDLFPRWFIGADYRYRMYSDDNQQSRYKLWSMYHLFGEMNQFKLKYSYENIRNNDENVGRDNNFRNDFRSDDRVYWSPEHYWQHLFTFHFKHYFDFKRQLDDPLSYCSFDYSYGYEEDFNQTHGFDLNIFLEINRHFLLKGNFSNKNGEDYEETEALMSLIYRW